MQVKCPSCGCTIDLEENEQETTCPNVNCHAPYHFRMFFDKEQASSFYKSTPSWKTKYFLRPDENLEQWIVANFNDEIKPYKIQSITMLIGNEILRSIQAGSADNLGGPITLIEIRQNGKKDADFRRIEPLEYAAKSERPPHMRLFTEFCTRLRMAVKGDESGDALCMQFDLNKVKGYMDAPPYIPKWHFCWCGLVDYIVPVIIHGQIIGVLFSGQKRKDDPESNSELKRHIIDASQRLGLDPSYMINLVFNVSVSDVKVVDEPTIEKDIEVLKIISERLEVEAYRQYMAEREVREGHFLEEITSILLSTVKSEVASDELIKENTQQVLRRISAFVICFKNIALLLESGPDTGRFNVVASDGLVTEQNDSIDLPPRQFDTLMPDRLGPIRVKQGEKSSLYESLSEKLFPFNIGIGYVLRMRLSSNRYMLLVLASPPHTCIYKDVQGFCRQSSELAIRFLMRLGNRLSTTFDVLLAMHQLKTEDQRRKVFFLEKSHNLSIPMQSIIADSAYLESILESGSESQDYANHLLTEAQKLNLILENILYNESKTEQTQKYFSYCILKPLKEACEMFMGEASEKGCDIQTFVLVDNIKVQMPPEELDDLYALYSKVLYEPIKEEMGIPKNKIILKDEILGDIIVEGKSCLVLPEKLPKECFEKHPSKVIVKIQNQKLEVAPEIIARKYLIDVSLAYNEFALALKNIVHNAVKYSYRTSPESLRRYVEIICELVNKEHYKISISNYGIGITKHEINEGLIWQEGYRGALARGRKMWGSGLGLTHAKRSIEVIHGGKIKADSILQHGSTYLTIFTITIPTSQMYRMQ